jgi:predicted RNA-binding protein with PIN domain
MNTPLYRSLLLVDGYNIIGAWSSLKKTLARHGMEPAREELVAVLIDYSHHQDCLTRVVFDSHLQDTPSNLQRYTSHLSVYFTARAQTADTYIEKTCADFRRERGTDLARIVVATSDNAQRLTAMGYGAEWLSAPRLESEVALSTRRRRQQQRSRPTPRGRFLVNSLDSRTRQQLDRLRYEADPGRDGSSTGGMV